MLFALVITAAFAALLLLAGTAQCVSACRRTSSGLRWLVTYMQACMLFALVITTAVFAALLLLAGTADRVCACLQEDQQSAAVAVNLHAGMLSALVITAVFAAVLLLAGTADYVPALQEDQQWAEVAGDLPTGLRGRLVLSLLRTSCRGLMEQLGAGEKAPTSSLVCNLLQDRGIVAADDAPAAGASWSSWGQVGRQPHHYYQLGGM
jgi:hypothetical protein